MKEVKADPAGSWVVYGGSKVVKFKTHGGAKAYAEKSGGKVASSEFYADKIQKQGMAEDADQVKKIFKDKSGKPVGEIGIDPESSPGNGEWYVHHYATGYSVVGFDSAAEAKRELMYVHKHPDAVEGHPSTLDEQSMAEGGRSMDRATVIQKLEAMYTKLYQREDPESYDLPAAVMYWSKLPLGELAMEFHHAEDQLKQSRGIKEAETDYQKRRARERDVDAGRPVKPLPKNPQTDYARKRAQEKRDMELGEDSSTSSEAVEIALIRRVLVAHTDLIMDFGLDKVTQAIEEVAYNVGDVDEIGSSDVSGWIHQVKQILGA